MKSFLTTAVCILSGLHILRADVQLQEGFNGGGLPAGWIVSPVSGTTSNWAVVGVGTNPPISPYAGTGQARFNSYDATPGHQSRLTSRRIDFTTATDPFLVFFMYHDDEFFSSFDSVYVETTTGDSIAGPWTPLAGYQRPLSVVGWKREVISLLSYAGSTRIFVGFRGVSQYGNNIYIDEVRIADSSFHDIGSAGLLTPGGSLEAPLASSQPASRSSKRISKFQPNEPVQHIPTIIHTTSPLNLGAVVQNYGTFSEASYQVRWMIDGQMQAPVNNTQPLTRNGRDTLPLLWPTPTSGTHVITAWTSLGSDTNRNNDTARITVATLDSTIIFAEMFNAPSFPPPGWSVVNRDGGSLAPWFQGTSTSPFLSYEGTGYAADNFQRSNGTYIDDYLISPPIPGIAQPGQPDSLKLWVRSALSPPPATNYADSLMILLSTTGADTSNFNTVLDYFQVPKTGWSLKGYSISARVPPNSTIRVACRYLHYNGGQSGSASDFIGVDFLHIVRGVPTSVKDHVSAPRTFTLHQNYPNPFNPSTEIAFSVEVTGKSTLRVFDIVGRTIATLFDDIAVEGTTYRVQLNGVALAGGVYFYELRSGARSEVKKLVLLK